MSAYDINVKVAEEICEKYRLNGQAFQRGECVALFDGKVVAVEKDPTAAINALVAMKVEPERCMVFEVGPPQADYIR